MIAAPMIIPASALGKDGHVAPSERITIGVIGLGGQGTRDMQNLLRLPDTQIVALCDVDEGSTRYENGWYRGIAPAADEVSKHYAQDKKTESYAVPDTYTDFLEVLVRKDIDAVAIATPDHWHALIGIYAAHAGKDVYCQKPLARTIPEGRAMVDVLTKHKRVFQCGSQRRSELPCRIACEAVRNEQIGKLNTVEVGLPGGYSNPGYDMPEDPMPVPSGFDYDRWLGPAPDAPYTHKRCHFTFRWNLDYSGGQITDWGAHFFDMAHWGMGTEDTGPATIEGTGSFPPRDELWNTATEFSFDCEYAKGVIMKVKSGTHGVRFIGDLGHVGLDGKVHMNDESKKPKTRNRIKLYRSADQYRNFIDCLKSREITAAPIETAHRSISPAHLGNIAIALGRKLNWDPAEEQFINDDEANKMLHRTYRAPWTLENAVKNRTVSA